MIVMWGCLLVGTRLGWMGGDNVFAYSPNPIMWIDPLGLNNCKPSLVRGEKKDKITPISGSYQSGINRAWALEKELVELTDMVQLNGSIAKNRN